MTKRTGKRRLTEVACVEDTLFTIVACSTEC
jgi:hypothetical protein